MKLFSRTNVRWASIGLLATSVLAPSSVMAQDDDELETFTITGSRIPRLDVEGPNPVLQLTRDSLDASGFATVGDALRSLPFNSGQSLTPVDSGTSFTPGVSTVNLRGLGNNNVLILVNGRRAAPFGASGFNGFQTLFDLNSIPAAAIESVEILKDGASAIYGSDAVSGVVNIKLRRDFEGMSMTAGVGNTLSTDSFEKSLSVIAGTRSANTSIVVTADWYQRNAIFARDLDFTSNADLRDVGGIDRTSTAGFPGLVFVPGVGFRTFLAPTANPTVADAVPFGTPRADGTPAGRYNFLQDSDLFPETRQMGFYTSVRHQVTDTVALFTEVSFRRAETLSQSAPTPMFSFNEQGDSQYGDIEIPANNPFNPWGVTLDWDNRVRFVEVGNRLNDVISDTPRILIGAEGAIGTDWTWEIGALYTRTNYTNNNQGAIQDRLLQDAFNGVTFEEGTPDEVTLFLNPFGPSDQRILDYMTINNPVTSQYQVQTVDFSVGGTIFELPAGSVGIALGGEFREERLEDFRTALNETGQIVGGSEGSSIFGDRNVKSLFVELAIPVLPNLEFQLAARYEDYSDFGDTLKPKVAAIFRPISSVILRAGYSQSFLAPNLPYLYSAQSTSFTSSAIPDPRRPNDAATQIKQLGGGNPDLQPEETDTFYAGIAFSPTSGVLEGLYVGVDFFIFDSDNLLDRNGAGFLLDNELDANGNPTEFAQFIVRNPPAAGETVGTIQFIRATWENISERYYRGLDFDIRYDLQTANFGRFRLSASATYLDRIDFGGANAAGSRLLPQWRGNVNLNWRYADYAATLFVNYIGSRSGTGSMSGAAFVTNERYASQITVNPQVSYSGFFDTTITVGVRNVLNSTPPLDYGDATRFTGGVNNPEPRFVYMRVSRDF